MSTTPKKKGYTRPDLTSGIAGMFSDNNTEKEQGTEEKVIIKEESAVKPINNVPDETIYMPPEEKPEVKEPVKVIQEPENSDINADNIMGNIKAKKKGHQKSVYFNDENYNFIADKCAESGAKFSDVLNYIIKYFRENDVK